MRARVRWTEDLDQKLKALRASGLTWDALAVAMGMGRNTVLERGRRIGARKPRPTAHPLPPPPEAADRPARPPGHASCWGLITAGTVLDGAPYPYPVFQ